MVVLVPRQIRMAGMTGGVPYYGGRFTPAQAYAVSHPSHPSHSSAPSDAVRAPAVSREAQVEALQRLLDTGVLTKEEFDQLHARVNQ
jgi:hypothetical protein